MWWYRLKQVWWDLTAIVLPVDYTEAEAALSPELLALFKRMRKGDQRHGLRVMGKLTAAGHTHPDLLVAALLHDVGKARYRYTVFDRTLVVLAKRFAPRRYACRSRGEARGLWRPLTISAQHPQWSAEDMAAAGASGLAVALARRHQDALEREPNCEEDRLLVLLQSVDDES
jgi:hypothetical protein